ncbi:MAG TPA: biotin--[acetyl-CoA-carboxylase] ligase [Chloroflexota bacterium]|nr:biotin--[acetyl-CoA-carboxylase] ligase [Chloroflexota bacterium]
MPLSAAAIRRGLRTTMIGRRVICEKAVGSTNDWLKAAAADGAPEGTVVFAEEQTAGRGQAGRNWQAPYGCCLLGSILLRPHFPPERIFDLTMLGACAAAGALIELTGLPVQLKWPNDLISESGKMGGVLAEASTEAGELQYAILGIGINVNLSVQDLGKIPGATSILAESGRTLNRNALARALLTALDERYGYLCQGDYPAVLSEWRERLNTLGKWVNLTIAGHTEGPFYAETVSDDGALILLRPDGSRFTAVAGEVSVRPRP